MSESTNVRVFNLGTTAVNVSVTTLTGRGRDVKAHDYPVDPTTGIIAIPTAQLPASAKSRKEYADGEYVQAFRFQASYVHDESVHVFVTQRNAANEYHRTRSTPSSMSAADKLWTHEFLPCTVAFQDRDGKRKVFTSPKSQSERHGINRADIWVIGKDGKLGMYQVLVVTFDDGKTFRVVGEWRWKGRIYRLATPSAYLPQAKKPVFQDPVVQKFLNQVIVVPEAPCLGFDNRAEMLEDDNAFEFLEKHVGEFAVWTGPERNFSTELSTEGVKLEGNRGVLKWFSHGMFAGGGGFVEKPVRDATGRVVGKESYQVHYSDFGAEVHRDEQGMIQLREGDIIAWDDTLDMGINQTAKEPYPRRLINPRVEYLKVVEGRAKGILPPAKAA